MDTEYHRRYATHHMGFGPYGLTSYNDGEVIYIPPRHISFLEREDSE